MTPRILLVGEDNPHSLDPRHALYPHPPGCAGDRLCHRILDEHRGSYLEKYDRTNLCSGAWSTTEARVRALDLLESGRPMVLLGARVARAFGLDFLPFSVACGASLMAVLPHPSGRCRLWNDVGSYARARATVEQLRQLVEEVASCSA